MGSIPVAGAKSSSTPSGRGAFAIRTANPSPRASAKRNWVRNIAPPLPRRKPCGAGQIPVAVPSARRTHLREHQRSGIEDVDHKNIVKVR